jgi:hypothetical protein
MMPPNQFFENLSKTEAAKAIWQLLTFLQREVVADTFVEVVLTDIEKVAFHPKVMRGGLEYSVFEVDLEFGCLLMTQCMSNGRLGLVKIDIDVKQIVSLTRDCQPFH